MGLLLCLLLSVLCTLSTVYNSTDYNAFSRRENEEARMNKVLQLLCTCYHGIQVETERANGPFILLVDPLGD